MSDEDRAQKHRGPTPTPGKRIETQIHRRRKVKASSPLESEWEAQSGKPPEGLRTPEHKMKK